MDLIHSTFQASFNARIERLQEQETNELRTIFRYFDTDGDGAVSADQVLRIFGLLGLSINPAYVRDLGEVYLAEFLKIVDSHVPVTKSADPGAKDTPNGTSSSIVPLLATATMSTTAPNQATNSNAAAEGGAVELSPQDEQAAQERANAQLWEEEWRILDSYGRGVISRDELRLFLRSCFSPFPVHDLDRFLELYADPSMPEDSMTLTKTAFLRFRRDYTARERAQSEHNGDASDDEQEGDPEAEDAGPVDLAAVDQTLRGGNALPDDGASQQEQNTEAKKLRAAKRGDAVLEGHVDGGDVDVDGIVIDPGVMDDDFVDDDDGGGVAASAGLGDHDDGGNDDDRAFFGEEDDGDDDECDDDGNEE